MESDYRAYPILCVDDEPAGLSSLRDVLEPHLTVFTARSGEEALHVLAERDVAVLLTDERMPGMSGGELCARARALRPETVRMMFTTSPTLESAVDAIHAGGISRYIIKPWRDDELVDLLRAHVHAVDLRRSARDMEMRLLRTAGPTAASVVHSVVAHDIFNVLHAMKLNAEIAHEHVTAAARSVADPVRTLELANGAQQCTSDVLAALEQLEGIVQRLRHAKPAPGAPVPRCDAARAVGATVGILRHEVERIARLSLVVDASPTVGLDSVMLGQVVLSLITNAVQGIPAGAPEDHEIGVRVAVDGDFGLVSVSDTGPGVPDTLRDRIFDAGVTTKSGGSGLGLAIVRDIVTRAHGKVTLENRPEGGSRFLVRVPIVPTERPATRPQGQPDGA